MSTTAILSILFVLELVIVGFGLSTFLYVKLRNLKRELASKETQHNAGNGNTLHDLIEQKITQTREKIAEKASGHSEQEHEAKNALLNQRIEYLKLEKDLLDENTENTNFWSNIFSRLSAIFSTGIDDTDIPDEETGHQDESSLRRRLSKYKKLLGKIIQEFRNYRENARKLADAIGEQGGDAQQSVAIRQSIEEFNKNDELTRQRLEAYQQEIVAGTSQSTTQATNTHKIIGDFTSVKASEEEIKRLQTIIGRQYDSLSDLKKALLDSGSSGLDTDALSKKLDMVEKSQKELQTCVEVLEMENQRLGTELHEALQKLEDGDGGDTVALREKNNDLEEQLSDSLSKLKDMERDYNSLQQEFMRIYDKNQS